MDRKIGERAIEGDDPESCDPGWWPWSSYCSCALETDNCDPTITEYAPTLETRLIVTTATVLTITRSDDLPAVTETGTTTLTTTYTTYKLYGSTVTTTVSP